MIGDAIALYELIRKMSSQASVLSALFDVDGTRLEGDENIGISLHPLEGNDNVWWYEVQPIEGYEFIRIPVNAGAVIESLGTPKDGKNRVADYFRYVSVPDGHIYGGTIVNVRVKFMVFGYRPTDLMAAGKGKI